MIAGYATPEGTAQYQERFPQLAEAEFFRRAEHAPSAGELWLSSLGLGTYLGEPDDVADVAYTEAPRSTTGTSVRSGTSGPRSRSCSEQGM
jgi:hypothetical protein